MRAGIALLAALAAPALSATVAPLEFENTAIVRTIELGGSLVKSTTTFAVRALRNGAKEYSLALPPGENSRTRLIEARIKGSKDKLALGAQPATPIGHPVIYTVDLPNALAENGTVQIVLDTMQTHATFPWPKEASQTDAQLLMFQTDLFVLSPYETVVQRTKIKSPTPKIESYTTPKGVESFTSEVAPVTKSGTTLTYGPFNAIPASADTTFLQANQRGINVQYGYDYPVLEISKLRRLAEISHWGANLNIQDEIHLHNAGPVLKGHFNRLEHQSQKHFNRISAHILPDLTLHLPAGIRDPYYRDIVGNVSTSKLRVAPRGSGRLSELNLRPRYPLLGGWNYSFTLGYDAPLADSAVYDKESGSYVVGVPIMTLIPGVVVDDAEVMIILPEGATNVGVATPFPAKSQTKETHVTFLDSIGRPAITFQYEKLVNTGTIYVTYQVSTAAHLRKIGTVATALLTVFGVAIAVRRVDLSLTRKK